jgi:phosphatidyl-myo-inositol alpha-mannosyltransferase
MRIGMVCPYDLGEPGGVQAQVLGLSHALTALGDEVVVIGPGLPSGIDGVDLGRSRAVPGNQSVVPLTLDLRVGREIERASRDVDVLHVHEPLMPMASLRALRAGPPVVGTFHAAPSAAGRRLYGALGPRIRRVLGPNVRCLTAVSAVAAAPLPAELDLEIVPNGIDVASFAVDTPRVDGRVSFLGRDERRKGLDVLVDSWPEVTRRHPGAELVVMGASREQPGITWMGRVDDVAKARVLASSAVYVAPNLGGESFGIVLAEAMAAGAAVLASDLESFRAVAGDAARYFEVADSSALADELVSLLADPDTRAGMAERGLERVGQFDWTVVASAYRSIYVRALS